MKYGKVRIEDKNLIYAKRMKTHSLPCEDILWAYRRKEEVNTNVCCGKASFDINSVVIITQDKEKLRFEMTESEAIECLAELRICNPRIITGYPKGTRIPLKSLPNTRDLGGMKTKEGEIVLAHRLLRSGELYHVSHEDRNILIDEYQVSTVVDFRTESEREQKPDTIFPGVQYYALPILDEEAAGVTRERGVMESIMNFKGDARAYMQGIYESMIHDSFCTDQYARFFEYLLKQEDGAVLWHCSVGKDRVGIGTALVLSALGVPEEAVIEDYLRTNVYLEQEIKYILRLAEDRGLDENSRENIRVLLGADESYIRGVFRAIEEEYDTLERFLRKKMYLTPRSMEVLHEKYLA